MQSNWTGVVALMVASGWCIGQVQLLPRPAGTAIREIQQRSNVSASGESFVMWSSVGSLQGTTPTARGQVWNGTTGWSALPIEAESPWTESVPMTMSSDGRVIFGRNGGTVFRWTSNDGATPIFSAALGRYDAATATNADGSVLAGFTTIGNRYSGYRWTSTGGLSILGELAGYRDTIPMSISSNGGVIVGYWNNLGITSTTGGTPWYSFLGGLGTSYATESRLAFRWTASGGMQPLGEVVPGGGSVATLVSGNGNVIFGNSNNQNGIAFLWRWTEDTGMQVLPNTIGSANAPVNPIATSHDGTIMVGLAHTTNSFYWSETTGFMNLLDYFQSQGVDTSNFLPQRIWVSAMSPDGLTFVGWAQVYSPGGFRPFVVTIPAPGWAVPTAAVFGLRARRRACTQR